MRTVAVFLVS